MSAREKLMANAAILLIVTILLIIAIALYWIHFRGLDQPLFCYQRLYKDDLLVNVKRSMERILLLGDNIVHGCPVDRTQY
jgi:hypothetical protein